DLVRRGRRGDRQGLVVVRIRIVIERALGRRPPGPGLEGGELLERRQVVAARRDHHLLGRFRLAHRGQQALGRRLVLAEAPGAPEERQERTEAAGRTGREAVRPTLLGDLRRVALGDRPGRRRVHDEGALARHQPLVVGGVVPRRRVFRQEGYPLLVVLERLTNLVVLDRDLALGVA